jgi:hypothetical protein
LWITSALYGGYVAANFLKWIWWRKMNIDEWDGADEALLPSIAPGAMHCHRPVGGIGRHL